MTLLHSFSATPDVYDVDPDTPSNSRTWQAALLIDDVIYTANRPARHHTVLHAWCKLRGRRLLRTPCVQGFMTPEGEFLNRHGAFARYEAEGNVGQWPPRLFSEDLWGTPSSTWTPEMVRGVA